MKIYLAVIALLMFGQTCSVLAEDLTVKTPATVKTVATESKQDIVDPYTTMKFVFVKGGCYKMGSTVNSIDDEQPVHDVCVSDFYFGQYEVTQGQWEKVMKNNPSYFKQCGLNCPVESVSWDDSQEYIKKLNALSNKQYRLPTEAEWEYAARGGGTDEINAGTSVEKSLGEYAWIGENSGKSVHPVGQKKANGMGLYDMVGNVAEWCLDWYEETFYKSSLKTNPLSQNNSSEHVTRGGDWSFKPHRARVAHRSKFDSGWRESRIGLRLALPVK